jgi:3D (Asp-Asp-Asp) domain-containing protein
MNKSKFLFWVKRVGVLVLLGLTLLVFSGVVIGYADEHLSRVIVVTNQIAIPRIEVWIAVVTAYNSEIDQTDDSPFITASGQNVRDGIVACPRELAFGTKVKIQGRVYECQDRMNKKFDDRFDIWMTHRGDALAWGKQKLGVEILRNNDLSMR